MTYTHKLLDQTFGRDLGGLIDAYIISDVIPVMVTGWRSRIRDQTEFAIGRAGYAELVDSCDSHRCLYGLVVGGYTMLINASISRLLERTSDKRDVLNKCLAYACAARAYDIQHIIIAHGAIRCKMCKLSALDHWYN